MPLDVRFDPPLLLPVHIDPKGGATPFVLACDLTYRGPVVQVTVEAGFRYDMASIPKLARLIISNTDPRIVRAATIHDKLYAEKRVNRRIADAIFADIMRYDRMPWIKRTLAYWSVRLFGGLAWRRKGQSDG